MAKKAAKRAKAEAAAGEEAPELTPAQKRAAARDQADEALTAIVRKVPKRLYNQWSGRQTKVLHEQARRYGMPLEGGTIDLIEVVEWIHDFLAENKRDLAFLGCDDDDVDEDGFSRKTGRKSSPLRNELVSEQVEQLRKRNQLLDAKLQEAAGTMVPRDTLHRMLGELAKLLRHAGHSLYKINPLAGDVMAQTMERFGEVIERFADGGLEQGDEDSPETSAASGGAELPAA